MFFIKKVHNCNIQAIKTKTYINESSLSFIYIFYNIYVLFKHDF